MRARACVCACVWVHACVCVCVCVTGVLERESSVLPDAAPPTGPTASTAGAWPLSPLLARALELQLTQALARGDYSQALHPLHGFLDHAHVSV